MDKKEKIISIGLPVVKPTYLSSAIESCLNQTYTNIEIIILNNASTKEVGDEIESIVKKHEDIRLKYYRNTEQLPMIENWNKVLSYANGDLFSLLCDDDYWDPLFIQKMVFLAIKYPNINLFHSRVLITKGDGNNNESFLSSLCNEYEDTLDFIYHRLKGYRNQYLSDFMVRLPTIREIGGFVDLPDGWGSDDITWFLVAASGEGVAYDSNLLFIYRDHEENITNLKNNSNKLKSLNLYVEFVLSMLSKIEIKTTLDEIKKNNIIEELKTYEKQNNVALWKKALISNSVIPNFIVPFIIVIYKIYRHLIKS